MKKQVVIIHGGDTHKTREDFLKSLNTLYLDIEKYKKESGDWKTWLRKELGPDYEVVIPQMPNKFDAKYPEWELWFNRIVPLLADEVVLIGHSLGGSFLVKYLSLNKVPKKILAVGLVSAVYDYDSFGGGLLTFELPDKLDMQTDKVFIYHSTDDTIVPVSAMHKLREKVPFAETREFTDRWHFVGDEFPELLEDIRQVF